MALRIDPKSKLYQASSHFALKASAFDNVNYRAAQNPPNLTITADTPNGVLGGMIAKADDTTPANWTVDICTNANSATEYPIGFFNLDSEGAAFENAPAAASGKLAIFHGCKSIFNLYVFETHGVTSPYSAKTLSSVYAVGKKLYVGPYGLVNDINPSVANTNNPGIVVATVIKTPSATDLEMGILSNL